MILNCVLLRQSQLWHLVWLYQNRAQTGTALQRSIYSDPAYFADAKRRLLGSLVADMRRYQPRIQREALNRRQRKAQREGVTLYRVTRLCGTLDFHTRLW